MTKAQKRLADLLERQSKERQRMAELSAAAELTDETRAELDTIENGTPDLERQIRAARIAAADEEAEQREEARETEPDAEDRERAELRGKVRLARYVGAAMETRAADGAEAEYNAALGLPGNRFPLELLAPERRTEARATTDADAAASQGMWVDRLFSEAAAMRIGVTFRSVAPGIAAYPVTSAGASAAQRGRREAAADAAWTVSVEELKPTRNAVRAIFSEEDAMRLPSVEDALRRDLGMALMEGVDRTIFLGDDGANEDGADITGLNTAANVVENTIAQADKGTPSNVMGAFTSLIDGKHASAPEDLRIAMAVGANSYWSGALTVAQDAQSLAQFLRTAGLTWRVRGDLAAGTGEDAWTAFVGRARGIEGAGVAAIWNSGMLIRDMYTGAAKGEIALTLSYFWNFGLPRPSNFARIKFAV